MTYMYFRIIDVGPMMTIGQRRFVRCGDDEDGDGEGRFMPVSDDNEDSDGFERFVLVSDDDKKR